jgi:hypothetical protein
MTKEIKQNVCEAFNKKFEGKYHCIIQPHHGPIFSDSEHFGIYEMNGEKIGLFLFGIECNFLKPLYGDCHENIQKWFERYVKLINL